MTLHFTQPRYPTDRRVAMSGSLEVGAVFPPIPPAEKSWRWQVFLKPSSFGKARSELAAKNIIETWWADWLRAAELEPKG